MTNISMVQNVPALQPFARIDSSVANSISFILSSPQYTVYDTARQDVLSRKVRMRSMGIANNRQR
jgi:hypothetical protein